MRKFCCEVWRSSVEYLQVLSRDIVGTDKEESLITTSQLEAIGLWSQYCPACGLSLTAPVSQLPGDTSKHLPPTQSTQPLKCSSCKGTGKPGGVISSSAKCTPCLGTGLITPKRTYADKLVQIEDLKNKIRTENKPLREDAQPKNYKEKV